MLMQKEIERLSLYFISLLLSSGSGGSWILEVPQINSPLGVPHVTPHLFRELPVAPQADPGWRQRPKAGESASAAA